MGRITADPAELRSIAGALAATADRFGHSSRLRFGPVDEPQHVAHELPAFEERWTRWIDELRSTLSSLATGLHAAADVYDEQEQTISAWARP
jgi:hypothetical protein